MANQTEEDRAATAFRMRRAEAIGGHAAACSLAIGILDTEECDARDFRRMRACSRLRSIGGAMWRRAFVGMPNGDVLRILGGRFSEELPADKLANIAREYNARG